MNKSLSFAYGLIGWFGFLGLFLYVIGFLGDFLVPKTVNSGVEGPVGTAILINVMLIALFGIHHSVAARPGFKQWITKWIPPHLERSTYVHISNVLFFLILWQWQPVNIVLWHVDSAIGQVILYTIFAAGWALVVLSSFAINHFDLFGVRHVFLYLTGKPYTHVPFKISFLYKFIRNPLMLGWFMAFWSTPHMTVGHMIFAAGLTLYGLIGIHYEEKTLLQFLGDDYKAYHQKTPMLLPLPKMNRSGKCPLGF